MSDPVRRLVATWQDRVWVLAYRMLGNEADAADATQEVFAVALRRADRFDATRDFGAWMYRVATREILRFGRERARRVRYEAGAAMIGASRGGGAAAPDRNPAERSELRELVESEVAALEERERSALVLHVFGGLSAAEVARVLEIPRTTIRRRIARAFDVLRRRLEAAGYPAAAVGLERWLAELAMPEIPTSVAASILAGATAPGAGLGATTGAGDPGAAAAKMGEAMTGIGGVMSKKIGILAGAIGCVLFGAGLGIGRWTAPAGGAGVPDGGSAGLERPLRAAAEETAEDADPAAGASARRLGDAAESPESAGIVDRRTGAMETADVDREPVASAEGASAAESSTDSGPDDPSGIDWGPFSAAFARVADLAAAVLAGEREPEELDEAERAALMAFLASAHGVGAQAADRDGLPFFDSVVLGELVDATVGRALGLDADARARLVSAAREVLAQARSEGSLGLDAIESGDATPLEIWATRARLVDELQESLRSTLLAGAVDRYDALEPAFGNLLRGRSAGVSVVGLDGDGAAEAALSTYAHRLGLDERAAGSPELRRVVEDWIAAAEDAVARFGGPESGRGGALDGELGARLDAELLRLQIEAESRMLPWLDAGPRAALFDTEPHVMRFRRGVGVDHVFVLGMMF